MNSSLLKLILLICGIGVLGFRPMAQIEVPMERKNGILQIKGKANSIPMSFIFDTGASGVTMSSVEYVFLLKGGYIDDADMLPPKPIRTADGSVVEAQQFILSTLEIICHIQKY